MASTKIKLYSTLFCPFAQRAWIALLEKGIPFDYVEIDLYDKTPEFLAINPRGLVPVLVQGQKSVYESAVCIEFIDENWPNEKHLLPKDAWDRSRVRIMADYISKKIVPLHFEILQLQTKEGQDDAKARMLENLKFINNEIVSHGPFISGENFGMADIMLVPFSLRFSVLKHYRDFEIPHTDEFKNLHAWMNLCHSRESVTPTVATNERLIANYESYANNTAQSQMAEAIRKGTVLP